MRALVIGGSGFVSSEMVRQLLAAGHEVYTLTRGQRKLPEGVTPILADRASDEAVREGLEAAYTTFDAVYDCVCMSAAHAKQDLEILPAYTKRLVVISTDSVYDPARKSTPQTEEGFFVEPGPWNYESNKRAMELVFFEAIREKKTNLAITLFRPGHIYGAGAPLGCYPEESRKWELPDRILQEKPMRLLARGIYIIQPIFVSDLVKVMRDCTENENTYGEVFCIGGPKAIENKIYYETLAELLGKPLTIEEVPLTGYVEANPQFAAHLNHRIYDLGKLEKTGVPLPATSLKDGLRAALIGQGYSVVE